MTKTKIKNQTRAVWSGLDYLKVIGITIVSIIIMLGIILFSIYINGVGVNKTDVDIVSFFNDTVYVKKFIYVSLMIVLLYTSMVIYFYFENGDFFKKPKNTLLIYSVISMVVLLSFVLGRFVNIYARPIVLASLIIASLVNKRSALYVHIVICLLMFVTDTFTNTNFILNGDLLENAIYTALLTDFICGIVCIFFVSKAKTRINVLYYGLILLIPEIVCVIILSGEKLVSTWMLILYNVLSGAIAVVLYLVLLPLFEVMFNKITDYRLGELVNHNSELLQILREKAPGTFNHSIVVANLAEVCAIAIGENAMLARACAYYHDIGKLKEPRFFVENQMGEENNLHNDLTPELSTNIIRMHAKDGYDLAKQYKLPDEIANACIEHHGTLPIKYFYAKALKFTDGNVDIKQYSYQGPKPQSKITALLMICDASEAMVRTLKERDRDSVDKAVQNIIDERIELGQFDECPITMKDLYIIKNTIDNSLTGIYHSRIKYPKVKIRIDNSRLEG